MKQMDMYTLLYLKWITNKDLLQSTWNSAQYYIAAWTGGEFGGEWVHVYTYGWIPSSETITTLLIGYTPIQNQRFKKKHTHIDMLLWWLFPSLGLAELKELW